MYYLSVEETLQALFQKYLPLSHAQSDRLAELSLGMLLANSIYVTRVARWVGQDNQQASRVRFIQRLLDAPYVCAELVYQPWLRQALSQYRCPYWHLIMDRTALDAHQTDLLSVSLSFRGRAIPLRWQCIPHGGVDSQTQIKLLEQLISLSLTLHISCQKSQDGSLKVRRGQEKVKMLVVLSLKRPKSPAIRSKWTNLSHLASLCAKSSLEAI